MPDPFISGQDLVNHLNRGDATDPGMLIAVDAACDTVRTLTELTVNKVYGEVVTLDGSGTDALLLPGGPVTAAGTVTVNGGTVTDYVLNQRNGTLVRTGDLSFFPTLIWPAGRQNVTVTYDHGWPDEDIPRDLRMVALAIATRLFVQGPSAQETIGDVSVRYAANATDLTAGELRILNKYRPSH